MQKMKFMLRNVPILFSMKIVMKTMIMMKIIFISADSAAVRAYKYKYSTVLTVVVNNCTSNDICDVSDGVF
jgi:hypothetical protein